MLKFNPERQLILEPNQQNRLSTTLIIQNPSSRPAPFKVKSTRPPLFHVEPPTGIISPQSSVTVTITTKQNNSSQLAHEVSYHNRFLVEFALIDHSVNSPDQGLRLINEGNRQQHKLYLVVSGKAENNERDDKSTVSRGFYKTVPDDDDYQRGFEKDKYGGLNEEDKDQYITRQLGRLEKQKSELVMIPKPKGNFTTWKLVAIFLIAMLLGNLLGHSLGIGSESESHESQEKEEEEGQQQGFGWFGLAEYWRQPQKKQQHEWWQFWK